MSGNRLRHWALIVAAAAVAWLATGGVILNVLEACPPVVVRRHKFVFSCPSSGRAGAGFRLGSCPNLAVLNPNLVEVQQPS